MGGICRDRLESSDSFAYCAELLTQDVRNGVGLAGIAVSTAVAVMVVVGNQGGEKPFANR